MQWKVTSSTESNYLCLIRCNRNQVVSQEGWKGDRCREQVKERWGRCRQTNTKTQINERCIKCTQQNWKTSKKKREKRTFFRCDAIACLAWAELNWTASSPLWNPIPIYVYIERCVFVAFFTCDTWFNVYR